MDLGERVAITVLHAYDRIVPAKRKPREGEWTVLSAFVLEDNCSGSLEVVSLGSGTKCLGESELSSAGDVIHDSHGEVLARRGLKRFLLSEIRKVNESKEKKGIFSSPKDFLSFSGCHKLHFFSSHLPCGDATIRPMKTEGGSSKPKKMRLDGPDIHRTGAKCVANQALVDQHLPGTDYHVVGAVRTKPGRGPRTKSLSCSDKMLKWNYFGVSGRILQEYWFKNGLYWSSITVNCLSEDSESVSTSLKRAIINRCPVPSGHSPEIYTSHLHFKYDLKADESNKYSPCANSVCWSKVSDEPLVMLADGRKYGLTKKHFGSKKSIVPISRLRLAETAFQLLQQEDTDKGTTLFNQPIVRYSDLKPYRDSKLQAAMPQLWLKKDDINEFVIKGTLVTIVTREASPSLKSFLEKEFLLSFLDPTSESQTDLKKTFYKLLSERVLIDEDCLSSSDAAGIFDNKKLSTWAIIRRKNDPSLSLKYPLIHLEMNDECFENKLTDFLRNAIKT